MISDERVLWKIGPVECVMVSCCSGAELQMRLGDQTLLRELYPTKSDLYERARCLEADHRATVAADAS